MKPPSSSPPNRHEFRESWLRDAAQRLRPDFAKLGYEIPENIRFAIAFTSTGRNGNRKSESWHAASSADSHYEIFIRADIAHPVEVLGLLVKELVHTVIPDGSGHGKAYRGVALNIGLIPPMRTARPSGSLLQRLEQVAEALGPLPHERLNITDEPLISVNPGKPPARAISLNGYKKQTARMLRATCASTECGFLVRVAAEKVRDIGPPHCPRHGAMVVEPPAGEAEELNGHEPDDAPGHAAPTAQSVASGVGDDVGRVQQPESREDGLVAEPRQDKKGLPEVKVKESV